VSTGSLAADARDELAAIAPTRRCDRLAELAALFHAAGTLHLRGRGALALHLDLAGSAVARRARSLLDELRVQSEIRTYTRRAFARETRYQLHVEGDEHARAIAAEAGILDTDGRPLERPPGRIVARECCRGSYLRGAFLGGGSLSLGRSAHLELRTATLSGAAFLRVVASTEGIRLRVLERPSHAVSYAKSWDDIEAFLAAAGAIEAVLALEERAVVAELRGQANRLANADHANLVRSGRAAQRQLAAARRLRATGVLQRLPDPIREAAELRLRHPTLSLRELAGRTDPPATKSGMQRRLARVVRLGEDESHGWGGLVE
jgi:DNA-binding protein WhiA